MKGGRPLREREVDIESDDDATDLPIWDTLRVAFHVSWGFESGHFLVERGAIPTARNGLPKRSSETERQRECERGDDGTRTHDPLLAKQVL
jgi:hypothetical protein